MFLVALSITTNKTHAFLGLASVICTVAIFGGFMLPVGSSFVLVTDITSRGNTSSNNLMQIPRSELSTHSSNAKEDEEQSGGVNNNEEDVESLDSLYSSKTEESLDALPPLNSNLTPNSPTNDTASKSRSCKVLVNVNTSEDKIVEERWEDDDQNMNTSSTAESVPPSPTLRTKLHRILTILIQKEYLALLAWFSLLIVPLQYYIGTIGYQLEKLGDDGYYTNIFSITYASAAALAPFGGYLSDRLGLGLTQGLATSLSAVSFYFLAVENLQSQLPGMCVYSVGRLLVFGMYFSNIGKRFGYTNYGVLAGLGLMVTAIVSLLQYPLITLVTNGYARQVNIVCGSVLLIVGLPYCLWLGLREKKDEQEQQNEVEDTTINEATTATREGTRATPTRQSSLFRASFIRKPSYFAQ